MLGIIFRLKLYACLHIHIQRERERARAREVEKEEQTHTHTGVHARIYLIHIKGKSIVSTYILYIRIQHLSSWRYIVDNHNELHTLPVYFIHHFSLLI